jgi:hypothetical protein
VAGGCGLALGLLTVVGPTHFSPQQGFGDTVIDLMFVRVEDSIVLHYDILADIWGRSDHMPLTVVLPGPESYIPATCWTISADSDEEEAYVAAFLSGLEPLLQWRGDSTVEVDGVVKAISDVFDGMVHPCQRKTSVQELQGVVDGRLFSRSRHISCLPCGRGLEALPPYHEGG